MFRSRESLVSAGTAENGVIAAIRSFRGVDFPGVDAETGVAAYPQSSYAGDVYLGKDCLYQQRAFDVLATSYPKSVSGEDLISRVWAEEVDHVGRKQSLEMLIFRLKGKLRQTGLPYVVYPILSLRQYLFWPTAIAEGAVVIPGNRLPAAMAVHPDLRPLGLLINAARAETRMTRKFQAPCLHPYFSPQQQRLLRLAMTVYPEPVPRRELMDGLWPKANGEGDLDEAFCQITCRVREKLGAFQGGRYELVCNPGAGYRIGVR